MNKAIKKDKRIKQVEVSIKDLKKAMKSLYKRYKINKLDRIIITQNNLLCYLQNELEIKMEKK